ncbi:hypothetical protein FGO68_gene5517 [Halteria grandinella]|uniref:Uncharacterized protein n=1 Tax=Halteria grandinella TaxID=5974 RepID=A0A8J8P2B3_HALGN|nr:hypothetical protein FGO68_gene5517 [Halteria grandinella]
MADIQHIISLQMKEKFSQFKRCLIITSNKALVNTSTLLRDNFKTQTEKDIMQIYNQQILKDYLISQYLSPVTIILDEFLSPLSIDLSSFQTIVIIEKEPTRNIKFIVGKLLLHFPIVLYFKRSNMPLHECEAEDRYFSTQINTLENDDEGDDYEYEIYGGCSQKEVFKQLELLALDAKNIIYQLEKKQRDRIIASFESLPRKDEYRSQMWEILYRDVEVQPQQQIYNDDQLIQVIKGNQWKCLILMPLTFHFLVDHHCQDNNSYSSKLVAKVKAAGDLLKQLIKQGIMNKHFQLDKDYYRRMLLEQYPPDQDTSKNTTTKSFRVLGVLSAYSLMNDVFFFILTGTLIINKFYYEMYGDDNEIMNLILVTRLTLMLLFTIRVKIRVMSELYAYMFDVSFNICAVALGFYVFSLLVQMTSTSEADQTCDKKNIMETMIWLKIEAYTFFLQIIGPMIYILFASFFSILDMNDEVKSKILTEDFISFYFVKMKSSANVLTIYVIYFFMLIIEIYDLRFLQDNYLNKSLSFLKFSFCLVLINYTLITFDVLSMKFKLMRVVKKYGDYYGIPIFLISFYIVWRNVNNRQEVQEVNDINLVFIRQWLCLLYIGGPIALIFYTLVEFGVQIPAGNQNLGSQYTFIRAQTIIEKLLRALIWIKDFINPEAHERDSLIAIQSKQQLEKTQGEDQGKIKAFHRHHGFNQSLILEQCEKMLANLKSIFERIDVNVSSSQFVLRENQYVDLFQRMMKNEKGMKNIEDQRELFQDDFKAKFDQIQELINASNSSIYQDISRCFLIFMLKLSLLLLGMISMSGVPSRTQERYQFFTVMVQFVSCLLIHIKIDQDMRQALSMLNHSIYSRDIGRQHISYVILITLMQMSTALSTEAFHARTIFSLIEGREIMYTLATFIVLSESDQAIAISLKSVTLKKSEQQTSQKNPSNDSWSSIDQNETVFELFPDEESLEVMILQPIKMWYKIVKTFYQAFFFYFSPFIMLYIFFNMQ